MSFYNNEELIFFYYTTIYCYSFSLICLILFFHIINKCFFKKVDAYLNHN
jgi:hypothetical protein